MALFGFIRDGVLEDVGQLPTSAVRLDTGQEIQGLNGINRKWAQACGWYDLTNPADVALIPGTIVAQLAPVIAEEIAKQQARRNFVVDIRHAAALAKESNWDWLDRFSGIPIEGSPNAGIDWPTLSTGEKAEALRIGLSRALFQNIKLADVLLLMIRVLADLIDLEGGDVGTLDGNGV